MSHKAVFPLSAGTPGVPLPVFGSHITVGNSGGCGLIPPLFLPLPDPGCSPDTVQPSTSPPTPPPGHHPACPGLTPQLPSRPLPAPPGPHFLHTKEKSSHTWPPPPSPPWARPALSSPGSDFDAALILETSLTPVSSWCRSYPGPPAPSLPQAVIGSPSPKALANGPLPPLACPCPRVVTWLGYPVASRASGTWGGQPGPSPPGWAGLPWALRGCLLESSCLSRCTLSGAKETESQGS